MRKIRLASAIALLAIFIAPHASAQFGTLVDKAKKKAKDALNGTTTPPPATAPPATTSNAPPATTPPATATTDTTSNPSETVSASTTTPSAVATVGKRVYTYCFLTRTGLTQSYMSDVFPVNFVTREALYATTVATFRKFVSAKYPNVISATGRMSGSIGCEDGWATEAEARSKKAAELTRRMANPSTANIVETGFTESSTEVSTAQTAGVPDINSMIQAEQPYAVSYCENI